MFFHSRQRTIKLDDNLVKINGDIIPFSHANFFFITIDNHFEWKVHINNISTEISKGVGILLRLTKELPDDILVLIYNTLILPYLAY